MQKSCLNRVAKKSSKAYNPALKEVVISMFQKTNKEHSTVFLNKPSHAMTFNLDLSTGNVAENRISLLENIL